MLKNLKTASIVIDGKHFTVQEFTFGKWKEVARLLSGKLSPIIESKKSTLDKILDGIDAVGIKEFLNMALVEEYPHDDIAVNDLMLFAKAFIAVCDIESVKKNMDYLLGQKHQLNSTSKNQSGSLKERFVSIFQPTK